MLILFVGLILLFMMFCVGTIIVWFVFVDGSKKKQALDAICNQLANEDRVELCEGRRSTYVLKQPDYILTIEVTAQGKYTQHALDIGVDSIHTPSIHRQGRPPFMADAQQVVSIDAIGEVVVSRKTKLERFGEMIGFKSALTSGDETFDQMFSVYTRAPTTLVKYITGTQTQRDDITALANLGFEQIHVFSALAPVQVSSKDPMPQYVALDRLMQTQAHMTQLAQRLPVFEPMTDKVHSGEPDHVVWFLNLISVGILLLGSWIVKQIWSPLSWSLFLSSLALASVLWIPYLLFMGLWFRKKARGFRRFITMQSSYLLVMPMLMYCTLMTLNGVLPAKQTSETLMVSRLRHSYRGNKCHLNVHDAWLKGKPYNQRINCKTYKRLKKRQKAYRTPFKVGIVLSEGGLGFRRIVSWR